MRYLLITYLRKPGGQIDEQVGFSKKVRTNDIQTCNVILDYLEQKVVKCVIEGNKLDRDFGPLHEYYKKAYPNMIEQLEQINFPLAPQPEAEVPPTTEEKKDGQ